MADSRLAARLESVTNQSTMVLSHTGRKSGKSYDVTIWFAVEGDTIYLETLNPDRSWVKNVAARPEVRMKIGDQKFTGTVKQITDPAQFEHVNGLVKRKYIAARIMNALLPLLSIFVTNRSQAFVVTLTP